MSGSVAGAAGQGPTLDAAALTAAVALAVELERATGVHPRVGERLADPYDHAGRRPGRSGSRGR